MCDTHLNQKQLTTGLKMVVTQLIRTGMQVTITSWLSWKQYESSKAMKRVAFVTEINLRYNQWTDK